MRDSLQPIKHEAPGVAGLVQRVALCALACILAFTTFVSAITIAELHDHDCDGDDCAICLVLEHAQAMLSSAADVGASSLSTSAPFIAIALSLAVFCLLRVAETPVSQRVKLVI